jgi:hypothetical protein
MGVRTPDSCNLPGDFFCGMKTLYIDIFQYNIAIRELGVEEDIRKQFPGKYSTSSTEENNSRHVVINSQFDQ